MNNYQAMNPFNKPIKMHVVRLLLARTGQYHNQFLRPYVTQANAGDVMGVIDAVSKQMGNGSSNLNIDTNMVTGLVSMSAAPGSQVVIPNGWQTERLRFSLTVSVEFSVGGKQYITVQGYTEYSDLSHGGRIDPNMKFFINTMTSTNVANMGGFNTPASEIFNNGVHVLADNACNVQTQPLMTMRPQDVFSAMQHASIASMPEIAEPFGGMYDSRLCLKRNAVASNLDNSSPVNYMKDVISSFVAGTVAEYANPNEQEVLAKCSSAAADRESAMVSNPFIQAIMANNQNSFGVNNSFHMRDLYNIDQGVDAVTMLIERNGQQMSEVAMVGNSATWMGSDMLTHAANFIARTLPAIMLSNNISSCFMTATNNVIGCKGDVMILNVANNLNTQVTPDAFTRAMMNCRTRIISEIMNVISHRDLFKYNISINYDQYGDTRVEIDMNNSGAHLYVSPTFADSMLSPVVTNDVKSVYSMANDISTLTDNIKDVMTGNRLFGSGF